MVASVKTPLISADFGSALKNKRIDTENLCFRSWGQHCPYLTHHSKTNTRQGHFHSHRPVVPILFRCSQCSQCDLGLQKRVVPWAHGLGSSSQIDTVADYGSHSLIRWCGLGWKISCSGGPSPCFPLSALPCSTSAHGCGANVSPRRDIKMCSECLGKLLTLYFE